MTAVLDAIRTDKGTLEYDELIRSLIFTERLGPEEYGVAAIVARDVPRWMGEGLVEALAALDRAEAERDEALDLLGKMTARAVRAHEYADR